MIMKRFCISLSFILCPLSFIFAQQPINDNNTPLHLMKPEYRVGYGVSDAASVKQTMDRVLKYIDAETPAVIVNKNTGKEVSRMKDIDADSQLKQGGFRLTSYEWGVTYSGVLAAYEATGDEAYKDYVYKRHKLLAEMAPYFTKLHQRGVKIDGNARRVVDPHALDDAGAVCCSMIKAMGSIFKDADKNLRKLVDERISNYTDYIMNKEYRLSDGTFARIRPQKNTVWLDDMFMGVPTVAYMGQYTGDAKYFDEAARQVLQFAERMWVPEKNLSGTDGWSRCRSILPSTGAEPTDGLFLRCVRCSMCCRRIILVVQRYLLSCVHI